MCVCVCIYVCVYMCICRWIVDRNSTDNGSHLNGSRSSLITRKLLMFNQSKVVPTVLSTTPKMYIYPTKSQKSPLFTFQPILWRHSRFFPYLAEIGLEPRVKRHMENVLFPWQETIEGACGSSKLQNSHWSLFYVRLFHPCDTIFSIRVLFEGHFFIVDSEPSQLQNGA